MRRSRFVDCLICSNLHFWFCNTWWRHQMETFSAKLAICAGNSPVPGEFSAQRPMTWSFDVFFDLRLNKVKSKSKSKIFYYNKIIIIHRMTQRLKPIWIYLSYKFLPLFTLQRPHFDDNSVSMGASTEAVRPNFTEYYRYSLWSKC